jgi:hypothetical protein
MKTKICRMCKESKQGIDFYKSKENLDGLFSYCKACSIKRWKEYNSIHKAIRVEKSREYGRKNLKLIVAKNRKYREKNKERCNGYSKKWASNNVKKVKARQLWNAAKNRAKKLGLDFDLTKEFIYKKLDIGICEYTGLKIDMRINLSGRLALSPSMERKIPSLGYTQKNVVLACWAINAFKSSHTIQEIIPIAKAFLLKQENNPADGTQGDPASGVLSVSTT